MFDLQEAAKIHQRPSSNQIRGSGSVQNPNYYKGAPKLATNLTAQALKKSQGNLVRAQ